MIDAASRGVDTKSESESRDQHPSGSAPNGDPDFGGAAQIDEKSRAAPPESDESQPSQTSPHERKDEKGGSNIPDPIDRIESVTRSSLAGSLRFVSAAVRGVGDAVFQAGAVAEGLAGGTGQVAGEVLQRGFACRVMAVLGMLWWLVCIALNFFFFLSFWAPLMSTDREIFFRDPTLYLFFATRSSSPLYVLPVVLTTLLSVFSLLQRTWCAWCKEW